MLRPVVRPRFKRNFVLPGVVLTALEVAVVLWPLGSLFRFSAEQRAILLRAAGPVAGGAILLWLAALASWLSPVQRAISARRRGEELAPELAARAYRALGVVPLRLLWLRTALWIGAAVALGVPLSRYGEFEPTRVGMLVSVVGLHAFFVAIVRAAWMARLFGSLRTQLFPTVEPLQQIADRYARRILLVALLVGAGAIAALAAFIYYFLPIKTDEYLQVQLYLPGAVALTTVGWIFYSRHARRDIDAYLDAQLAHPELTATADPRATAAYRSGQTLPYRLAAAKVVSWTIAAAVVAAVARWGHDMDADNAVLMFGAAVVILVGSAIYEAVWHRATIRPLLAHLAARHRLPVRDIRTPLSLRTKLLFSFGGLVLFACGLSLFWGFVQYKKLATAYLEAQAQLKLDWLRAEAQAAARAASGRTPSEAVWRVVEEASIGSAATGAVFYYVPSDPAARPLSAGGGVEGAPKLPWYAAARLRAGTRGSLQIGSLGLAGHYQRLVAEVGGVRRDLGVIAVLYPGYRGRGPGIERPLKELLVFFLVLFGVCGGIVVLTVGDFTSPIRELEVRADEMARGELSRPVNSGGESDEVGRLTFAMEEMRRALREKLRSTTELNIDLEREVQRRTADLARKNRELAEALEKLRRAQTQLVRSEKMASIGQLVAGIAHEINNPVNAIVNTVGPLSEAIEQMATTRDADEAARLSEEIRDMVRVVQRGARRTKDIVQALHNYSRTDDERIVEFDLNRGLDDSLELLRHHLKGTITVDKRYGEVGRIKAHAGQIHQVFMNLLTNAAQALAGREGARIELVTERKDGHVVIHVSDNGPGIPEEHLSRIFDPFFTTKEVGQGTGLGLSIVHGIVERHGGTIHVESRVGHGTTFTVTLPVAHPDAEKVRTA